jgi:hypothetical protein
MAIDYNTIRLLLWAKNLGATFDHTITLGRLGLCCPPSALRRALRAFDFPATEPEIQRCYEREPRQEVFADRLLALLGAKEVVSVDRSNFEGATFLHDLNEPFPLEMQGRFDLVLDGGTLEHIFDFPSAMRHCLELMSVGGHFICSSPANQLMGHGFYQFSPEVYFRIFTAENGFHLKKVVLYKAMDANAVFYEVADPAVLGRREEIRSSPPVLLAVVAQKTAQVPLFASLPQQSDYAAAWSRSQMPEAIQSNNALGRLRRTLNPYWPFWLRLFKNRLLHRLKSGPATMARSRGLRRLRNQEIARERAPLANTKAQTGKSEECKLPQGR